MPTLNGLFEEFLGRIEPDADTRADAQAAHENVRAWLAEHDDFGEIHLETFLAGSYRRRTAVTPIKDVDIVVVCSMDAFEADPRPLLRRLKRALDDNTRYRTRTTPNRRSIQIELARIDMDIVPTVAPNGTDLPLRIPDRRAVEWFWTNPKGHITWTQHLNANTKDDEADRGTFVPLVKMAKLWKQAQLASCRHPKGMMLELSAGLYHDPQARDWADVFIAWLEGTPAAFRPYRQAQQVPLFPDPGLPGQTIKTGMEFVDFDRYCDALERTLPTARRARELAAQGDLTQSARLWRQVFGDAFPPADGGPERGGRGASGPGGAPTVLTRPDIREAPDFG